MMKAKDLQLLACLRENARQKITKISRRTKLPVSTIFDKLHEYKSMVRFTTLLNFSHVGYSAKVHFLLKPAKEDREKLEVYLSENANVNSLFKVNNGYDYLAEGIFRSMSDVEDFLEKIEDGFRIKEKELYYIIDDLKREQFLAKPEVANV